MIQKIPPLYCPQCRSTHVKPGFSKRKKRAFVRDGKIYCYDCNKITDAKGKITELKFEWRSHNFPDFEGID